MKRSLKKSFFVSIILSVVYFILAIFFAPLLKIEYYLMAMNGVFLFFILLMPITRGIMQGGKRFGALGLNMVIESVTKLILAIIFVYFGWQVFGAILGTVLGGFLAFVLSFFSLKDIIKSKEKKASTGGIYGYTKPTFVIILVLLVFYSVDIIIAKIFFSPEIAGMYAISSILAKTIFFGTQPISKAMFPIVAEENNSLKKKSSNAFMNALALLSGVIIIALLAFYFAPELIIRIFSGKEIYASAQILFYLGIGVGILSFTNLILFYKLSLGKVKNYMYLFVFLGIEIFLLSYFSASLFQFSIAFITSSAIFLWGVVFLLGD